MPLCTSTSPLLLNTTSTKSGPASFSVNVPRLLKVPLPSNACVLLGRLRIQVDSPWLVITAPLFSVRVALSEKKFLLMSVRVSRVAEIASIVVPSRSVWPVPLILPPVHVITPPTTAAHGTCQGAVVEGEKATNEGHGTCDGHCFAAAEGEGAGTLDKGLVGERIRAGA